MPGGVTLEIVGTTTPEIAAYDGDDIHVRGYIPDVAPFFQNSRVFVAPFDVVFSQFDVVEPDILYLSNERAAEVITPQHVRGAPELVVEIASPGTRKRDETINNEYMAVG